MLLDMVYIQRLNRFKEKYILDKKRLIIRQRKLKPSWTHISSRSSYQRTVKNSFLKGELLIILRITSSRSSYYYLQRNCQSDIKLERNINRKRLCAPKQHDAASEKTVKMNLAYRNTIKWNLDKTKGMRDWQNLYDEVSLYRGSFSNILLLLE